MQVLKFKSFVAILFFVCFSYQESYSQQSSEHRTLYNELKSLPGVYVKKLNLYLDLKKFLLLLLYSRLITISRMVKNSLNVYT